MLNAYPLHLLSTEQLRQLLAAADAPQHFARVLDIGAGSGKVSTNALYIIMCLRAIYMSRCVYESMLSSLPVCALQVTAQIAPLCGTITTTETSAAMARRLRASGALALLLRQTNLQ